MVIWDLLCAWRRPLASLARGLCTCSLAVLYLLVGLVVFSGYTPPSHIQASLAEEPAVSLPSSIAGEGSSATPETINVGSGTPFNTHHHPRFANGKPLVLNPQEGTRLLIIPKIIVQDFSAEDGSVRYKTPEYDPTYTPKRGRRPSWARAPTTLRERLPSNVRPSSLGLPPPLGMPVAGGLRPLYLVDGLKHRRSDVFVQNLLGFPGRKRVLGDVVAKDGSFVIAGL